MLPPPPRVSNPAFPNEHHHQGRQRPAVPNHFRQAWKKTRGCVSTRNHFSHIMADARQQLVVLKPCLVMLLLLLFSCFCSTNASNGKSHCSTLLFPYLSLFKVYAPTFISCISSTFFHHCTDSDSANVEEKRRKKVEVEESFQHKL